MGVVGFRGDRSQGGGRGRGGGSRGWWGSRGGSYDVIMASCLH